MTSVVLYERGSQDRRGRGVREERKKARLKNDHFERTRNIPRVRSPDPVSVGGGE